MGRVLRLILATLFLTASAPSGCAKPHAGQGPALWKLTDEDSTIWLLGTVHMLPGALRWKTARIDRAFTAAEIVYFETPTDETGRAAMVDLVQRYGMNPSGVTLSSLLSAEDRVRLAAAAAKARLDPALLEPCRPWLAAMQLSVASVIARGQVAESGVEHVLDAQAKAQGKTRRYFETSEQQVRFFADLPPEVELGFLRATLKDVQNESEQIDAMNKAWSEGDVKTLGRYLDGMLREAGPDVHQVLIVRRNAAWAEEIDRLMQGKGKVFVAVGAAHLIGDDSVPALLRKKGYTVEGP